MKVNLNNEGLKTLALAVLTAVICFTIFRGCNKPDTKIAEPRIIYKYIKKGDSIVKVVRKDDSVRIVYLTKWKNLKVQHQYDTTIVHEVIQVCDTLIQKDSTEITHLKTLHSTDSVIIVEALKELRNDSATIVKLNKKLRVQKVLTKVSFFGGLGLGVFTGVKLR